MAAGIDGFARSIAEIRTSVGMAADALERVGQGAGEMPWSDLFTARGLVSFLAGDVREVRAMHAITSAMRARLNPAPSGLPPLTLPYPYPAVPRPVTVPS